MEKSGPYAEVHVNYLFYVSARVLVHTETKSHFREIHTAEQIAFAGQFTFLNTLIIRKI